MNTLCPFTTPFPQAVFFDEPANNTRAQCPICGAYRTLKNIRVNGESTEAYRFPTHTRATRRTERPSWRRTNGEQGKWSWHTIEYHVTIEHR